MPLVSVITLSYNSPDLLAAIDSVIFQRYPKIEYIIVDDGSDVFSEEAIAEHIKGLAKTNIKDVKIFVNETNKGITKSGNIALSAVTGEYVFYLAGDDAFHDEEVIADWVNAFLESKAIAMTAYRDVYDAGMKEFILREPSEERVEQIKQSYPKELFEIMAASNMIFGCSTAFSAECMKKYGPYKEEYRLIDDYPFILKILRNGERIAFFDRVVVKYRKGGISSFENVNKAYLKENDKIFKNEVLPYVKDPAAAKERYAKWRKTTILERDQYKYLQKKEQYRNKPIKFVLLYLGHAIRHPERLILKIKKWRNG